MIGKLWSRKQVWIILYEFDASLSIESFITIESFQTIARKHLLQLYFFAGHEITIIFLQKFSQLWLFFLYFILSVGFLGF